MLQVNVLESKRFDASSHLISAEQSIHQRSKNDSYELRLKFKLNKVSWELQTRVKSMVNLRKP